MRMTWVTGALVLLGLGAHAVANHPMAYDHRAFDADPAKATSPIAPRLSGLGDYSFKVSTVSPESQYFFDQGLRLTYGFNHSEALRAFKEAARLDPANAMAYWGWALTLGPNLNMPMDPMAAEQAYAAIQEAVRRAAGVTPVERSLINALSKRYAPVAPDNRASLDQAYAGAMREVVKAHPENLEGLTLLADALMNLSPWNYWLPDGQPRENTSELLGALDQVLAREPKHPGALHLHIHAMEAAHPEDAVLSADDLRGLMPSAGHLEHMPSHIYMRVGRYAESFEANRLASLADESYIAQCKQQGIYPLQYYPHNVHFLMWSAMYQGRSAEALKQAEKVRSIVPVDETGKAMGALEVFLSQPLFVMLRFAQWERILAEPAPAAANKLLSGMWRYARGTALVHTGKARKAKAELKLLREIRSQARPEDFGGYLASPTMLQVAEQMLSGDIAAAEGELLQAVADIGRAVRLEDSMTYTEPPDWLNPTRHALGDALLKAGLPVEAAVVFWQDLKRYPDSPFALKGLVESYRAQGDIAMAETLQARFDAAWKGADIKLSSARF
jgi:tetratricopeptide (TPR) repeat protein